MDLSIIFLITSEARGLVNTRLYLYVDAVGESGDNAAALKLLCRFFGSQAIYKRAVACPLDDSFRDGKHTVGMIQAY